MLDTNCGFTFYQEPKSTFIISERNLCTHKSSENENFTNVESCKAINSGYQSCVANILCQFTFWQARKDGNNILERNLCTHQTDLQNTIYTDV